VTNSTLLKTYDLTIKLNKPIKIQSLSHNFKK
jgi:hypothetical protein